MNEISISQYKRARYFKIYYLSFLVWFPLSQHDRTVRLTYQSREGEGGGGGVTALYQALFMQVYYMVLLMEYG